MNNVRNILLFSSFIFVMKFCSGQKPIFGIKAGLVLSNSKLTGANPALYTNEASSRAGALVGVYFDIPSGKKLIFRPGVELVSKGPIGDNPPFNFDFVDFPISILYRINYTHGHLIAGGGPSIGVPINNSYSSFPLKTEFAVNGLIGYELPIGFSFNLNYNYGLSNASNNRDDIKKLSNRYLGITIGYSF